MSEIQLIFPKRVAKNLGLFQLAAQWGVRILVFRFFLIDLVWNHSFDGVVARSIAGASGKNNEIDEEQRHKN